MSESLSNAERNVWETLTNFQVQLDATFKDNQIVQDYALLSGFLSFVDSKLTRMVNESLEVQKKIHESGRDGSVSTKTEIDDRTVPLILRLYWEKICHPIFKWFQAWKRMISPKTPGEKPRYVEFRKMNAKLTKFFKSTHKFYYSVLEQIVARYDCSGLMPSKLVEELNLKVDESPEQIKFEANGSFAVLIVMTLHNCLLYLGTTHRYKTVGEKITNRYHLQDFEKSIRYLDLACLFLPSIGEAHLQKGLIYIQTENFGSALYQFTRSALARIPSPAAQSNLATLICDRNSHLRHKFDQVIKHVSRQEIDRTKIINKEVIEFYFVILFGSHFAPASWKVDELEGISGLAALERVLYEKISTRYAKNIDLIFENLIVALGGFDLLSKCSRSDVKGADLKTLDANDSKQNRSRYLSFLFKYVSHILHVIREAWEKNFEDFHYLAMVRVVECWLKSNRVALQYAHRDDNFCKALALLLNSILKSDKYDNNCNTDSKPTRSYYFEEDVLLKEFSTVRYALSDFNDEKIFTSSDSTARLMGYVPESEKLREEEEATLRLKAVVCSGRKFLVKNACGIIWNSQRVVYEFGPQPVKRAVKRPENPRSKTRSEKSLSKNKQSSDLDTISFSNIEEQMRGNQQGSKILDWGYSGSSAPMAPSTFSTKPSSGMTETVSVRLANAASSDGSVKQSSSSTTLSSYSPSSGGKLVELAAREEGAVEGPIPAEYLERQQQKHSNTNSFLQASLPPGMPPYGFPGPGALSYNAPLVHSPVAGTPQAVPPMMYPNQVPHANSQTSMVYPAVQPMPMYQPNNWMGQPFYHQNAYMYGAQQPHHQGTHHHGAYSAN